MEETVRVNKRTFTVGEWGDAHDLTYHQYCNKWRHGNTRRMWLRDIPFEQMTALLGDTAPVAAPAPQPTVEAPIAEYWEALKAHASAELATDTDIVYDVLDKRGETKPVGWFFTGDWHIGSKWVDYESLEDDMSFVGAWRDRHPGALDFTHMGDAVDGFMPNSKAGSGMYEELVTRIDKQEELFLYVARKAGPFTQMHYGCHHAWALTSGGRDPLTPLINSLNTQWHEDQAETAAALGRAPINLVGAKNVGFGAETTLRLGAQEYTVLTRHRMRRESSLNTTNAQRAFDEDLGSSGQRSDVIVLGHLHNPDLQVRTRAGMDKVWARTGAYKGGDCFARAIGATLGKRPNIGNILVIFFPDRHETLAVDWRHWRRGLEDLARWRGEAE